jgi:hypothetical protein
MASKYACLRFIVPWGDATFYQEQITVLKGELHDVAMDCPPARTGELKAFLEGAIGVHVYQVHWGLGCASQPGCGQKPCRKG